MDRYAIDTMGIPSLTLMENAAQAITGALLEEIPDRLGGRVAIICGKGNNGGDGMAVARLLREKGFSPEVILLAQPEKLSKDARTQLDKLEGTGVTVSGYSPEEGLAALSELGPEDTVIDSILGTGLSSPLRGGILEVVEKLNAGDSFVAAVDVPTGLSGNYPLPIGASVKADLTLTLAAGKPCLFTPEGAASAGKVRVLGIGIPPEAGEKQVAVCETVDEEWASCFFKPRKDTCHKGEAGRLLLVAGSAGKSGAAVLSALGALRAGAGLVTVACPESVQPVIASSLPEMMTLPLPETPEGTLSMDSLSTIQDLTDSVSAAGIGPGIGTYSETSALCRELYRNLSIPVVIDADGLNAFENYSEKLKEHDSPRILTPHPGEMSRLCSKSVPDVVSERYHLVPEMADSLNTTVLLKGYRTIIGSPGQPWRMVMTGGPHMAGPGFGDILTGIICALLARGIVDFDAASLGAWWHGSAADAAAISLGGYGLLASEAASALPWIEGQMREEAERS